MYFFVNCEKTKKTQGVWKNVEQPKALRKNPRTQDSIKKPKILGENPRCGNAGQYTLWISEEGMYM